jgi:hypothetical protein
MIIATTKVKGFKNRIKYKDYEVKEGDLSAFLKTMNELETTCKNQQSQVEVAITLIEEEQVLYKTDDFLIGKGNGYHVFESIENELLDLFPEKYIEINELMEKLILQVTNNSESLSQKVEQKIQELPQEPIVEEKTDGTNVQKGSVSQKTIKMPKKAIISGVAILSLVGIFILGFFTMKNLFTPSYENLISEERYAEAFKQFPEKKDAIEQIILTSNERALEKMEKYVQETSSKSAVFDLAYLKQEYGEVIKLQEEANTSVRKTALAVSYVKVGEIDKAYELNKNLNSSKLKQLIADAYEQEATEYLKVLNVSKAEEIQAKIHTLTLQNKLDRVTATLSEEQRIKQQLSDTSISSDKKSELEAQLKQTQEKIERIKKGVF